MNVAATRSDASECSTSAGAGAQREVGRAPGGHEPRVPGAAGSPRNRASARAGETASSAAEQRRAAHGGAHRLPRVLVTERRVAPRGDVHPRVDEGTQPPQVRPVIRRHVRRVLLAAFGDEVRLRDDRQPAQVRQGIGSDDRAVLDPVAWPPSREVKRGEGEHELHARHAVHRGRTAGGVRDADRGRRARQAAAGWCRRA